MDEVFIQPVPVQTDHEPPPQKTNLRKFLDKAIWVIFFTLLPVTVLIFLSQDSGPGDLFYPVKRSLENVVLAAASVSPATKIAFRTDLTQTRFTESLKLLTSKSDTAGLSGFIAEVQTAQIEVSILSNKKDKDELTQKLITKIDEYQGKLTQVQSQIETVASSAENPTNTSTPIPTSVAIPSEVSSAPLALPSPSAKPTVSISQTPTPVPPTASFLPSQTRLLPSPTQSVASPTTTTVAAAIDDTQKKLQEIKKQLEKKHENEFRKENRQTELERKTLNENATTVEITGSEKDEALKRRRGEKNL